MRMKTRLMLGIAALLLLTACGPSRYTSSTSNLSSIPEFAFVEPYSYIVLYGDDGKGYYNESSSQGATRIISNIINSERFPFSDMIAADYDGENEDIKNWLRTFPDVDPAKADRLRVPKSLRRILDKSGLRYGIVIYSYGYEQTKAGYQREKVEKAAGTTTSILLTATSFTAPSSTERPTAWSISSRRSRPWLPTRKRPPM